MAILKSTLLFLGAINLCLGSPLCHTGDRTEPTRIQIQKTPTQNTFGGIYTPALIQPRVVDNCNRFYYVVKDEFCYMVAQRVNAVSPYHIGWEQIIEWNRLDEKCSNMLAGYYTCVGVTSKSAADVDVDGSIELRSAAEAMSHRHISDNDCIEWDFAKEGDRCERIATDFDTSVEQLKQLNPGLDCGSALKDGWVCTHK